MSAARGIVILGLSITSAWGNGHATTYRGLMRELCRRGHEVLFLERDVSWYRAHRDLPRPGYGATELYADLEELRDRHGSALRGADLVVVGSYVPDGIPLARWLLDLRAGPTALYDIDTPVTLAALARGGAAYLSADLIPRFDLYLSFTGGPTLRRLEREFGSPMARALYCSVDPELYYPEPAPPRWDLGYLGTYAADRQPALERLLAEPARAWPDGRFIVAGAAYPADCAWPPNCARVEHLPPASHRSFYNAQRYTLNVTRADMVRAGYSPSVRLFEAAACGTPIISDYWPGLDDVLRIGREVLVPASAAGVLELLRDPDEERRRALGERARRRILAQHTAAHRAAEFEQHMETALAAATRAVAR
jgi:spore maturation protein CgeB